VACIRLGSAPTLLAWPANEVCPQGGVWPVGGGRTGTEGRRGREGKEPRAHCRPLPLLAWSFDPFFKFLNFSNSPERKKLEAGKSIAASERKVVCCPQRRPQASPNSLCFSPATCLHHPTKTCLTIHRDLLDESLRLRKSMSVPVEEQTGRICSLRVATLRL
jgi:hypothetical protein